MLRSLVGSEMCIRDSINAEYGNYRTTMLARRTAVATTQWLARRGYHSRHGVEQHAQQLQRLANTLAPANAERTFLRRTQNVCTIGPKIANHEGIRQLMNAGMNVARFNFSHGEHSWFAETFELIRKIKGELGRSDVAIALDTKGPEIRTGQLAGGSPAGNPGFVEMIERGQEVEFVCDPSMEAAGTGTRVYLDYPDIGRTLSKGSALMIDDGLIGFEVKEAGDGWVRAAALNRGELGERKGVNLPGAQITLPAVSEKDRLDLEFGANQGVDYVFASFVRSAANVAEIKSAIRGTGSGPLGVANSIQVVSKIENLEGVQNFDEILAESDGVMVARGDLGIEIPAPKVFVAQKLLVLKSNMAGKPVICATQMLESMVQNPRPTRAEVSDVANAVVDGCDAVMLSGETAKGAWPEEAVRAMANIAREAEAATADELKEYQHQLMMPSKCDPIEAVCAAASRTAQDQDASMIVVLTETSDAPRLIAKYRPSVPIVAACSCSEIARRCGLLRGVIPVVVPWRDSESEFSRVEISKVIDHTLRKVRKMKIATRGRAIVVHDSDIMDGAEMTDWVMRMLDVNPKPTVMTSMDYP
eukprot:TRINITY_DN24188_c0_g1_i1.p1 TRINITY_DN24188_c0_g1~~TRINITY_DN24188_c0_g1_i1.p1  ORF type:complete len:588 (-),score=164.58 TRINITY_DN24188_c0_g1_i1:296-2059(-)